ISQLPVQPPWATSVRGPFPIVMVFSRIPLTLVNIGSYSRSAPLAITAINAVIPDKDGHVYLDRRGAVERAAASEGQLSGNRIRSKPERLIRVITAEQVRRVAMSLPRTTEGLVRDCVKFRVGRIVYVAISPDETTMGFGFPKEERAALIAAEPEKFFMP